MDFSEILRPTTSVIQSEVSEQMPATIINMGCDKMQPDLSTVTTVHHTLPTAVQLPTSRISLSSSFTSAFRPPSTQLTGTGSHTELKLEAPVQQAGTLDQHPTAPNSSQSMHISQPATSSNSTDNLSSHYQSECTTASPTRSEDNGTNTNAGSSSSAATLLRPSLFHAVIRMIALTEGGIIDQNDPEFGSAVNDALYGILINKTHRLVYTCEYGLQLVEFIN